MPVSGRNGVQFTDITPGLYPTWIDDLVTLCRSHHEGLAELRTDRFNARLAGSPAQVVNLRYLAAVLRVADVMEFDPERTPGAILKHRAIAPRSKIYWYKDREISFELVKDGSQLIFAARTTDSNIHRAVLETARSVDDELLCCSALDHEGAFVRGTIPDGARFYKWPWPARLVLDVRERDASFVYIDGAFRPNTQQVLNLLSGTSLYGSPFAALRELLQNAMDAVKEQIARERLERDDPTDASWNIRLGALHKISLTLAFDTDGWWLVCADSGVGMTKEIIEQHLLVSGSRLRPEIRLLERRARAKGFSTGRTGQFGIGVLSYFMIADRMVVQTRRSAEAGGDPDNIGWQFAIDGLENFGQLSPISRGAKGTEIRLRLKREFVGNEPEKWWQRVERYIRANLRRVPCRFELRRTDKDASLLKFDSGWTAAATDFSQSALRGLEPEVRMRTGLLRWPNSRSERH
jgi:hypothetical protein